MYLSVQMRKTSSALAAAGCLVMAAALLIAPKTAAAGIRTGFLICYNSIVPSLFPFLFLVDYLFSLICSAPGRKRWVAVLSAVVFGMIGGFPMGARALSRLVEAGELSAKKASLLLCGCVNAGPAFLISAVGAGMFGSAAAGFFLFAALTVASLLSLFFSQLFDTGEKEEKKTEGEAVPAERPDFSRSLQSALTATLSLCGYILFFSCLSSYAAGLIERFGIPAAASFAFSALLEVSGACARAAGIGSVEGLLLCAIAISWSGISVILQVRHITAKSGMTLRYFLLSRPIHAGLSVLVLLVAIGLFDDLQSVMAGFAGVETFSLNPGFSSFFLALAVIFVLCEKKFGPLRRMPG